MLRLVPLDATGTADFPDRLRAIWDAGDAALPVDPRLPGPARDALLESMRIDEPVEDGDALVVPTSGTTGEPKGVVLTHEALRASATATSARIGVDPSSDRWLACLPLAHIGGLSVVIRAMLADTPLTVLASADPDAITASGASLVSLVPMLLARLDPSIFRCVVLGGAAPPPDRPPNVVATYGMTETGSGVVYEHLPLNGVGLRTTDDGVLQVRGPMLLRAYRDGTDPKDAEGWLTTGDLGSVREDGWVDVFGRADDVIITGGEKVWPERVERRLLEHPSIDDVAVVGRPDPEWGQRVTALVVSNSPPALDELRDWVRAELPVWCAPKEIEQVATLPRTTLGKLRRKELASG